MQVGYAAARRGRGCFVRDATAQQRSSAAHDLRHRALQVVSPDAIDTLQRPEQPLSGGRCMCRRDPDNRPPDHEKHHSKIRERRDGAPGDLLNGFLCGPGGGGRDLRSRSNPLGHE